MLALAAAASFGGLALAGAQPQGAWALAGVVRALGIMQPCQPQFSLGCNAFARRRSPASLGCGGRGSSGSRARGRRRDNRPFAVEATLAAVNLAWTGTLARRRLQIAAPQAEASPELRRLVARYALISSLGVILEVIVARRSEIFFLGRFSTETEIALYSISFAALQALVLIPSSLAQSMAPAIATLYGPARTSGSGQGSRAPCVCSSSPPCLCSAS